jgi:hypothetical protein
MCGSNTGPKYDRSCVFNEPTGLFQYSCSAKEPSCPQCTNQKNKGSKFPHCWKSSLVGGVYLVSSQFTEVPFEFAPQYTSSACHVVIGYNLDVYAGKGIVRRDLLSLSTRSGGSGWNRPGITTNNYISTPTVVSPVMFSTRPLSRRAKKKPTYNTFGNT